MYGQKAAIDFVLDAAAAGGVFVLAERAAPDFFRTGSSLLELQTLKAGASILAVVVIGELVIDKIRGDDE